MKKIYIALALVLAVLTSCRSLVEEWQPVFTGKYGNPEQEKLYQEADLKAYGFPGTFTTIKDLKSLYANKPLVIDNNIWVKGQIISSDVTGNIYREIYIQDETGGIDLKLGKSSLYSEYRLGQWLYVRCTNLVLGAYNGMPQLGLEADNTPTNDYETSYIDVQTIIDQHVFKGPLAEPLKPLVVTEQDIKDAISGGFTGELWGKLVTVPGLLYKQEIFALFYPNPNMPHKSGNPENRVFLSDNGTWGITTWALTKARYIDNIRRGLWDSAEVGSGATRYGAITKTPADFLPEDSQVLHSFGPDAYSPYKDIMASYATANYVSHYFLMGKTDVQVRSSGYSKFADEELDERIRTGGAACDITGILSIYSGSAQLSLVDEPAVSVVVK
ncbi:MAG: hypothetical protein J6O51_01545 [Bacteroidales bacterium]|nr:hypothetical protein [Bacteroidales bacterium]